METNLKRVRKITGRITCSVLGRVFHLNAAHDTIGKDILIENGIEPRVYLQAEYLAPCTKTGEEIMWKSGKTYLSAHMTNDEIVKQSWVTFEKAVKHEVMEGFKVDGAILFNPHVNFEELLKVSDNEVTRAE